MVKRLTYPVLVMARAFLQTDIAARHKIRQTITHRKIREAWDFRWEDKDDSDRAELIAVKAQLEEYNK